MRHMYQGISFFKQIFVAHIDGAKPADFSGLGNALQIPEGCIDAAVLPVRLDTSVIHGEYHFNVQDISDFAHTGRDTSALYQIFEIVHHKDLFEKCKSLVNSDYEATLNLIVSSHVGPNTTGIAIEWADEK